MKCNGSDSIYFWWSGDTWYHYFDVLKEIIVYSWHFLYFGKAHVINNHPDFEWFPFRQTCNFLSYPLFFIDTTAHVISIFCIYTYCYCTFELLVHAMFTGNQRIPHCFHSMTSSCYCRPLPWRHHVLADHCHDVIMFLQAIIAEDDTNQDKKLSFDEFKAGYYRECGK